jgi:hypothetical protein
MDTNSPNFGKNLFWIGLIIAIGLIAWNLFGKGSISAGLLQKKLSTHLGKDDYNKNIDQMKSDYNENKKRGGVSPNVDGLYTWYELAWGIPKVDTEYVDKIAKKIYDAKGVFNDDEDQLYSAIRMIPSMIALQQVSFALEANYTSGRDLLSYIESFTGKTEQAKIYKIIKGVPMYNYTFRKK